MATAWPLLQHQFYSNATWNTNSRPLRCRVNQEFYKNPMNDDRFCDGFSCSTGERTMQEHASSASIPVLSSTKATCAGVRVTPVRDFPLLRELLCSHLGLRQKWWNDSVVQRRSLLVTTRQETGQKFVRGSRSDWNWMYFYGL